MPTIANEGGDMMVGITDIARHVIDTQF